MAVIKSVAPMPDPPEAVGSTVERIIATVRERVRTGVYGPGQRLIEADFTSELGVSRGPVREAFRRLAAEGLLTEERHRGMRIRQVSLEDLRALYRVREALEGLAARMAAERVAAGADASALRDTLSRLEASAQGGDMLGYYELNSDLHRQIIELGDASILSQVMAFLNVPVFRMQFWHLLNAEHVRQSNAGHEGVVHAILTGQADEAERLMRRHVRESGERILASPPAALLARQHKG